MEKSGPMERIGHFRRWAQEAFVAQGSMSWGVSLIVHLALLIGLAAIWQQLPSAPKFAVFKSDDRVADVRPIENIAESISDSDDVGIEGAGTGGSMTTAPTVADMARVEVRDLPVVEVATVDTRPSIGMATAPTLGDKVIIKGTAGFGATGASGAIDRLTQEIMLSLEERPTLVVWLMDQSQSLEKQRATIEERFDRIYHELGIIQSSGNSSFAKHGDEPLLTSVIAFGKEVNLLTKEPTADLETIKSAVHNIKNDPDGIEMTFTAVADAAKRYQKFRTGNPRRNVMMVVVTDETGNDEQQLETALDRCRKNQMPVYVIGVPAPFGQRQAFVKYVDPDPEYDQKPQNIPVDQGPESALPESVQLGFSDEKWDRFSSIDSGFGPYALTRLCYETGGVYFAIHPNRPTGAGHVKETDAMATRISQFFDPEVMRPYHPDYISFKQYDRLLHENKARMALVEAAKFSMIEPMEKPRLRFPKRSDAELKTDLDVAQRTAAVLEPRLAQLYNILKTGEKDRTKLTGARWQAGYDLAMGRVLAVQVRTAGYNAILAKAKNGMKFQDENNDTWELVPADEVTVSSALEKAAAQSREYLTRVVENHPGTPWAYLAERELAEPLGWKWTEKHTNVRPPMARNGGGGGGRPPQDMLKKIEKPKPVRQNVKL